MKKSRLVLEHGPSFDGLSPEWQEGTYSGELVFTTGMTGYVEALTDPSYTGQILVFTYPLIGNYGVPDAARWESLKIHAAGVVIAHAIDTLHHHEATRSFLTWLQEQKIPLLCGVDTRAVTKTLSRSKSLLGAIVDKEVGPFVDPNQELLVAKVSCREPRVYGTGAKKVIAVDCGMKENIMRSLLDYPITVKRVPYNYDYSEEEFDGVFISNGPGDPALCLETIEILKRALEKKKPTFGICLGAQLMALAIGAKTYKLPFGHRGHNVPCQLVETKKCFLTSQNHGYAVDEKSLTQSWRVYFRNLNDGSVEGIEHPTLPFFSVQFHPEAMPGPSDTTWLFERFYTSL